MNLSLAQVNSWRLSRHHLAKRARKGEIETVVSDLCGVQAQVLSYAALAIWARVEGITMRDVQDALWKYRSLVKTWCMRGTLHLISASELPVYVAARKTTMVVKPDWLAKILMESIADELEEVEFEGEKRWVRRADFAQIIEVERVRSVKLLPSWDGYVMFYHPREFFVSQSHRARIFTKLQGNKPVLLIDGVAGGVWEQRRKSGLTEVRVQPFSNLSSTEKQLVREEAANLGEFMGTKVELLFYREVCLICFLNRHDLSDQLLIT